VVKSKQDYCYYRTVLYPIHVKPYLGVFSSAGSDYMPSPLPPVPGTAGIKQPGQPSSLPPPAVLFPPIAGHSKGLLDSSRYLSKYV